MCQDSNIVTKSYRCELAVLFEKILVLLDGSESSEKALRTGIDIVAEFNGKTNLIYVTR